MAQRQAAARILTISGADLETPALPPLQVSSFYSLHLGISSITTLVQAAVDVGCPALALTDRNAMYGIVPFLQACREADLPAIVGVTLDDPRDATRRATCWARSRVGYATLAAITTRRCLEPEHFDLVAELAALDPAEAWAGTGHLALLVQVACRRSPEGWVALLHPDGRPLHAPADQLQGMARRYGLTSALTSDVLMARPGDLRTFEIQRRIAGRYHGSWIPGEEALIATPDTAIWDRAAQRRWASRYREAAWGAREVAERCAGQVDLRRTGWVMPPCVLPAGVSPEAALHCRAEEGSRRRYSGQVPPSVAKRLGKELTTICQLGYAAYVLAACELVDQAREWGAVCLGRGSVADSLVAYCCGLTEVDPMAHDLYFERFLNEARQDPPDIDIDFSWRVRDRMLQFLFQRHPVGQVAMVGCHHKLHARGAYREAALALGVNPRRLELFRRLPDASAHHLPRVREHFPEVQDFPLDDPDVAEALEVGQALAGIPIATGMHPCGIVLAPRPLPHWTPLERTGKGYLTTQFEMTALESCGLLKLDVLSTRGLGTVDTVRATLRARGARDPLAENFQEYATHPSVQRLLRLGQTVGCFNTESPAMLNLNRQVRCSSYSTLIATSSAIRPGVAESGMMDQYAERHTGEATITHLHPRMAELLHETHGVMLYQEDVLKIAHHVAGLSLGEADALRDAMTRRGHSAGTMDALRQRFLDGCARRGMGAEAATEVWRQIAAFAGFAFCKAHSAALARLSMQTCRLKVDYPAEFLAAVLSNGGGYYIPHLYIEEARRWGLSISGPDVNGSQEEYWGYGTALRVGLMAIKGLHVESIATLLAARQGVPFQSFPEFLCRTGVGAGGLDPSQALLLIEAGACGSFGDTPADQRFMLLAHLKRARAQRDRGTLPLFPAEEPVPTVSGGASGDVNRRTATLIDLLGFLPSRHPLGWLRGSLSWSPSGLPLVQVRDLPRYVGQPVRVLGLAVTRKITETRAKGERMAFLGLDDETGTCEVTWFPGAYRRHARKLDGWGPFVVTGEVTARRGVVSLTATAVERATVAAGIILPALFATSVIAPFGENPNIAPGDPHRNTLVEGDLIHGLGNGSLDSDGARRATSTVSRAPLGATGRAAASGVP
ncbi:MAG TPA: DNA polymerase III subunit alpha [bacterium]|nr:DNA polymerase III subunit alpha [bacterium]